MKNPSGSFDPNEDPGLRRKIEELSREHQAFWRDEAMVEHYDRFSEETPQANLVADDYVENFLRLALEGEHSQQLIVDMGTGGGPIAAYYSSLIAPATDEPGYQVVGLDISPAQIGLAQEKFGTRDNLFFHTIQRDKRIDLSQIPGLNTIFPRFIIGRFLLPATGSKENLDLSLDQASAMAIRGTQVFYILRHPDSFKPGIKYEQYDHIVEPMESYKEVPNPLPTGYPVTSIISNNQTRLAIPNIAVNAESLITGLEERGWVDARVVPFHMHLKGADGEIVKAVIRRRNPRTFPRMQEWSKEAPLLMVVTATMGDLLPEYDENLQIQNQPQIEAVLRAKEKQRQDLLDDMARTQKLGASPFKDL